VTNNQSNHIFHCGLSVGTFGYALLQGTASFGCLRQLMQLRCCVVEMFTYV
jgi:hypothetical protein